MTAPAVEWTALAPAVAVELLGQPNEKTRDRWHWKGRGGLYLNLTGKYAGQFRLWAAGESLGLVAMVEREKNLDRAGAIQWLTDAGYLASGPGKNRPPGPPGGAHRRVARQGDSHHHPPPETGLESPLREPDSWRKTPEGRLWSNSQLIPAGDSHPARRWLAARRLWRPGYPLPQSLRWLPSDGETCAGRLIVCLATVTDWVNAWPGCPTPTAVQTLAVFGDGAPGLDRPASRGGLAKRTRGKQAGTVFAVGNPGADSVRVVEGVADCLAVASRYDCLALAVMSAGAMSRAAADLADLVASRDAVIHADADNAGQWSAAWLSRNTGARVVLPPTGAGKDAAAAAQGQKWPSVALAAAQGYAATLRACYPDWPEWEICRQTALSVAGQTDSE